MTNLLNYPIKYTTKNESNIEEWNPPKWNRFSLIMTNYTHGDVKKSNNTTWNFIE